MAATPERERRIDFDGPRNFRDLGGYATGDGRTTRWGVLYRSDALDGMTASDLERFDTLGITTVIDLRHEFETQQRPDPMPVVNIPVMSKLMNDDDRPDFSTLVDFADGQNFMHQMMLRLLDAAAVELGSVIARFADTHQVPAVFHCTAGKDRTGVISALLLETLGVSRDQVVDDYSLTAHYRAVGKDSAGFEIMIARGAPPEVATGALGSPPELMHELLDELDARYGGAERYLVERAGLDTATIAALRTNLLD